MNTTTDNSTTTATSASDIRSQYTVLNDFIGKRIRNEIMRQGLTYADFARMIHCERSNVYNIVERHTIDCGLLAEISRALHRNFLRELCDELDQELASAC